MKDLLDCLWYVGTEFILRFFSAIGHMWMICFVPYMFEMIMLVIFFLYLLSRTNWG